MYSLNQIWRLFATALGFVIFGLFGVLFKIILLPYLSGSLKTQIKARRLVTKSWCWFVKYITLMGVVEAHFYGFEKLGRTGQLMLANHPSLLDVVFILSRVPDANCVVKADLLHNPAMSSQIRACGYVLNREDFDFVEQIDEILQTQSLLIFPEAREQVGMKTLNFIVARCHWAYVVRKSLRRLWSKCRLKITKKGKNGIKFHAKNPFIILLLVMILTHKRGWLKSRCRLPLDA